MKNRYRRDQQRRGSHDSTLVLNNDGKVLSLAPLSTKDWQESILAVFKEKMVVIEEHPHWEIHSQKTTMLVPSILMMKEYTERKQKCRFSRKNIFLRDSYTCGYCGRDFSNETETEIQKHLTLDHVIPRSKNGPTTFNNLISACTRCNHLKRDRLWKPKIAPYIPDFWDLLPGYKKRHKVVIRSESWRPYIDWEPDNIIYIPPPDTRL